MFICKLLHSIIWHKIRTLKQHDIHYRSVPWSMKIYRKFNKNHEHIRIPRKILLSKSSFPRVSLCKLVLHAGNTKRIINNLWVQLPVYFRTCRTYGVLFINFRYTVMENITPVHKQTVNWICTLKKRVNKRRCVCFIVVQRVTEKKKKKRKKETVGNVN